MKILILTIAILGAAGFIPMPSLRPIPRAISQLQYTEQSQPWLSPVDAEDTIEDLERQAPDEFIEKVVDEVTGYKSGNDILRKYKPHRFWLWRQWTGTILQHGSKKV
jgi:hypothetical protein